MGMILDSDVLIRHERTGGTDFFAPDALYENAHISATTGCAVLTGNYLEFNRVPGLEVIPAEHYLTPSCSPSSFCPTEISNRRRGRSMTGS